MDSICITRKKTIILVILVVASVVIIIVSGMNLSLYRRAQTALGQAPSVSIDIVPGASQPSRGIFYDPLYKEIGLGTTVTWTNRDTSFHTVTSGVPSSGPSFNFDSGILTSGETFSHTFNTPGIFRYYCTLHPFMTGTINVR